MISNIYIFLNLKYINLSYNQLSNVLVDFSHFKFLWFLDLRNNNISELFFLSKIGQLGYLDLSFNNIKETELNHLNKMILIELSVTNNPPLYENKSEIQVRAYVIKRLPNLWILNKEYISLIENIINIQIDELDFTRLKEDVPKYLTNLYHAMSEISNSKEEVDRIKTKYLMTYHNDLSRLLIETYVNKECFDCFRFINKTYSEVKVLPCDISNIYTLPHRTLIDIMILIYTGREYNIPLNLQCNALSVTINKQIEYLYISLFPYQPQYIITCLCFIISNYLREINLNKPTLLSGIDLILIESVPIYCPVTLHTKEKDENRLLRTQHAFRVIKRSFLCPSINKKIDELNKVELDTYYKL